MGILDRMSRLVRANVNDLLDRAEDPDKMIDQIIRDMQTNITDARRQVAAMIAQEKELEADLKQAKSLSDEWVKRRSGLWRQGKMNWRVKPCAASVTRTSTWRSTSSSSRRRSRRLTS
jgi:phage shock protein A